MLRSRIGAVLTALLLSTLLASTATAQNKHERKGFWFNIGLGYGSLGCDDCTERMGSLSGQVGLGGALSQNVSLGVMSNGWTKTENGASLTTGTLTAAVRLYPSKTGGFFILAGLGLGTTSASIAGYGSGSQTGTGALVGIGWDLRVGKSVSLTPYWNGFATRYDGGDTNVGQIGLGLTVH